MVELKLYLIVFVVVMTYMWSSSLQVIT